MILKDRNRSRFNFSKFVLICEVGEHFRRYAHAIRIVVGLLVPRNSIQLFNEYEQYQISSGARAKEVVIKKIISTLIV